MTIYFTASQSQRKLYGENYLKIISILEKMGHKVIDLSSKKDQVGHYKNIIRRISDVDLVIAEVTYPSTVNIGHEITLALDKGKTVVGLYLTGKISPFLEGLKSDKFIYTEYSPDTLEETLKETLDYAKQNADTRFNFLIPSSLLEYLNWVAQNRHLPRSVYLRKLIESDMTKNKHYKP